MNVLVFVMSMLLLFAILTYGRLESFRNFAFVQAMFEQYMEKTERHYVNSEAEKRYINTVATKGPEKGTQNQSQATSRLNIEILVDVDKRRANPDALAAFRDVAKNLMVFLYRDQPFYKEVEVTRPNFLNDILDAVIRRTEFFTKKDKFKKAKEISTLDLEDDVLNEVFTKMLTGTIEKEDILHSPPYKSETGYYSLLDFITFVPDKTKIRVYLAPPQLLMALYENQDVVENIRQERYQLFLRVKPQGSDISKAGEEFKSSLQGLSKVPDIILDFGVSKTNPLEYE